MASDKANSATAVSPGYFISIRTPSFMSVDNPRAHVKRSASRAAPRYFSTPPNAIDAWRCASSGDRPRVFINRFASISMWKRISSAMSASSSAGLRSPCQDERRSAFQLRMMGLDLLRGGAKRRRHRFGQPFPARRFIAQAGAAERRQLVVLGAPVVVRHAPFTLDQPLLFETVKGGIERALLDVQRVPGDLLDAQQHAIAVQLAERHGFQNE